MLEVKQQEPALTEKVVPQTAIPPRPHRARTKPNGSKNLFVQNRHATLQLGSLNLELAKQPLLHYQPQRPIVLDYITDQIQNLRRSCPRTQPARHNSDNIPLVYSLLTTTSKPFLARYITRSNHIHRNTRYRQSGSTPRLLQRLLVGPTRCSTDWHRH